MPTYSYSARDQEGKDVAGRIAADDEVMVVAELRKRQLIILGITEEKQETVQKASPKKRIGKVKAEDLVIFTRQFATMVDAGIPILQSLEALMEQSSNPNLKSALTVIHEDIQLGSSLSSAFEKHP
ncbi:MAG: type II secretion system F family protein, partial [Candidatus Omnitrophica bacterium]|nr:type II secretion system F family protein [Candidatus Omnitrophota bacterium]